MRARKPTDVSSAVALRLPDAAALCSISTSTVRAAVKRGELKAIRVGTGRPRSPLLVRRTDLDDWLTAREMPAPAPAPAPAPPAAPAAGGGDGGAVGTPPTPLATPKRKGRRARVIFRHIGAREFSAYRSQRVSGIKAPRSFRHIGASRFSAYRSHSGQDGHLELNQLSLPCGIFVCGGSGGAQENRDVPVSTGLGRLRQGDSDREIARGK